MKFQMVHIVLQFEQNEDVTSLGYKEKRLPPLAIGGTAASLMMVT